MPFLSIFKRSVGKFCPKLRIVFLDPDGNFQNFVNFNKFTLGPRL